jgi:hypothetical protein
MQQAIGAQARLGQGTGTAYRLVRELVPFIEDDTVLYPYGSRVPRGYSGIKLRRFFGWMIKP